MSNFERHKLVSYIILIISTLLIIYYNKWNNNIILFIVGYYIGVNWITPDLDIKSTPYNKHKTIWYIFTKLSMHRKTSHIPIVGTIIQVTYLIVMLLTIVYIIGIISNDNTILINFIEKITEIIKVYNIQVIISISGIISANSIHIIQDKLL